jgi:hypothetical protein
MADHSRGGKSVQTSKYINSLQKTRGFYFVILEYGLTRNFLILFFLGVRSNMSSRGKF